jgi:hypothetical protein
MEGVDRVFWYDWSNRSFCSLYMVEPDGITPTEAARAVAFTHQWLKGKILTGVEILQDSVFIIHLKNDSNKKFGVAWSEKEHIMTAHSFSGIKHIVSAKGQKLDLNSTEIKVSILPLFFEY